MGNTEKRDREDIPWKMLFEGLRRIERFFRDGRGDLN
jgi:hypothetical protein